MTQLLPHVDEPRLHALKARLEQMSRLSVDFLVLLLCSVVIATLGLFQNSPAVIIGAMIIAPLMRPLVGLSLASLTADTSLLIKAIFSLLVGTVLGTLVAGLMALCFQSLEPTQEILARTHPTLLDLGVALFAGAVGAYCQTKANLAESLAGVAISVALVPPLSVVGIGLAFGLFHVWSGAALLYLTNLIGITVAGALVFLISGYTPLRRAKRGLVISSVAITLLIVPLAFSMRELILENVISTKIRTVLKEKTFTFKRVQLQDLKVLRFRSPMSVTATVVSSDQAITPHQVGLVQEFLGKEIGMPIEFRLRIIPATEVTAEVTAEVEEVEKNPERGQDQEGKSTDSENETVQPHEKPEDQTPGQDELEKDTISPEQSSLEAVPATGESNRQDETSTQEEIKQDNE